MRCRALTMLVGTVIALSVASSEAPAAKGVKKTAEQHLHGIVVAVHSDGQHHAINLQLQHQPKAKKKGQGAATKAAARANATTAAKNTTQRTLSVSYQTHVQVLHKGHNYEASLRAISPGEEVSVVAHHR